MKFIPRDLLINRKQVESSGLIDPLDFTDSNELKSKLELIYKKPLYNFMIVDKAVYNGYCLGWVQDIRNV